MYLCFRFEEIFSKLLATAIPQTSFRSASSPTAGFGPPKARYLPEAPSYLLIPRPQGPRCLVSSTNAARLFVKRIP